MNTFGFRTIFPKCIYLSQRYIRSTTWPKAYVWLSNNNNIIPNLAFENSLFDREIENEFHLFLWRNRPCVIIGRHQNVWAECNVDLLNSGGVTIARRYSGGGTVYQDLGNTCFTFLSPKNANSTTQNNSIILKALEKNYGILGTPTGRNDLLINGLKFSGSAYKHTKNSSLHHGTILCNIDSSKLSNYITPNKLKLQSKGISSVKSRIINLTEINPLINHQDICKAIIKEFTEQHGFNNTNTEFITIEEDSSLYSQPNVKKHIELLQSWDWIYGKSPKFTNRFESRFDFGTFEICFNVQNGAIKSCQIYTDYLYSALIENLEKKLKDIPYTVNDVTTALQFDIESPMNQHLEELKKWIIQEIQN